MDYGAAVKLYIVNERFSTRRAFDLTIFIQSDKLRILW